MITHTKYPAANRNSIEAKKKTYRCKSKVKSPARALASEGTGASHETLQNGGRKIANTELLSSWV